MDVASSEFHTSDGMYDLDFKVCLLFCRTTLFEPMGPEHSFSGGLGEFFFFFFSQCQHSTAK